MTELKLRVETQLLQGRGNDSGWAALPCELRFSAADPIAVVMHLGGDDPKAADWAFAFDLIAQASSGRVAGIGDVRLSGDPLDPNYILCRLSSPDGSATLRLSLLDVKKFFHSAKAVLSARPEVDIVADALDRTISGILEGSG